MKVKMQGHQVIVKIVGCHSPGAQLAVAAHNWPYRFRKKPGWIACARNWLRRKLRRRR